MRVMMGDGDELLHYECHGCRGIVYGDTGSGLVVLDDTQWNYI